MRGKRIIAAVGALAALAAAQAAARELTQDEVRRFAASGRGVELSSILDMVRREVRGDPVDIRAFDVEGVHYRVLVKRGDGQVVGVVVEARTGRFVAPNSRVAETVRAEAAANGRANGRGLGLGRSGAAPGNSGSNAGGGNKGGPGGGGPGGGNGNGGNGNGNGGNGRN